jgi:hypothetical protein
MKFIRTFAVASMLVVSSNSWATTIEFFNNTAFASTAGKLTVITFDNLTPGNGVLNGGEFKRSSIS